MRAVLLALPCVALVLTGLVTRSLTEVNPVERYDAAIGMTFLLVQPLVSLIVGDSILGAEVRSGTLATTWLSPTPFSTIVVARFLAGWLIAAVALTVATTAAALVADQADLVGPMALAMTATRASPGPSSGSATSSTWRDLRGSFSFEGMPSNISTSSLRTRAAR